MHIRIPTLIQDGLFGATVLPDGLPLAKFKDRRVVESHLRGFRGPWEPQIETQLRGLCASCA